jgi:hypothetical protein
MKYTCESYKKDKNDGAVCCDSYDLYCGNLHINLYCNYEYKIVVTYSDDKVNIIHEAQQDSVRDFKTEATLKDM